MESSSQILQNIWALWSELGNLTSQKVQALLDSGLFVHVVSCLNTSRHYMAEKGAAGITRLSQWLQNNMEWNGFMACVISVMLLAFLWYYSWRGCRPDDNKRTRKSPVLHNMDVFDLTKTAYLPGHLETVLDVLPRWLRSHDVNEKRPQSGLSLLLCACLSGEQKLVEQLIQYGADLHSCTVEGDSALYLATYGVLTSKQPWNTQLLELLITSGCDVNHQNQRGYTALHRAAARGNVSVIHCLLKHGADPEVQTLSGIYPIDSATNAGHIEAAELLCVDVTDAGQVWEIVDPHTPTQVRLGLKSPRREHLADSFIGGKSVKREILLREM